ncbi:MAG TPA: preprotein translocase subunit SecG [Caulobacteraceae bacterium]|nr:preprotein translocase subunit SecG [Caulobacteraceae bacterium]
MLIGLLLTLNVLICIALIGVVLLQPSEGGAFGSGNPTGLMTARGSANLLTKITWALFSMFLAIGLALTLLGGHARSSAAILKRLENQSINPNLLPKAPPPPAPANAAPAAPQGGQYGAPTPSINVPANIAPSGLALPPEAPRKTPPAQP